MLAEPETAVASPGTNVGTASVPQINAQRLRVDTIDIAVCGADVAGLAAALAVVRAQPTASVVLYDTAAGPPASRDGGALLSVNGLRALRALDPGLYSRLTSGELSSTLHEALWFDLEGELLRRAPLGLPPAAPLANAGGGGATRRRSGLRRKVTASGGGSGAADPDPASPPLMVGLHELREALSDALPPEVEIFGRHHLHSLEPCPAGGALLHFAASPASGPVRSVRARLVVGADGADSALKRLQFDTSAEVQPEPSGRVVWRGRFTLRPRDPDFARLRNFTTASRTWVDLRAPPGCQRSASLSPAGPNTFVWTASCPASMLPSRGLTELTSRPSSTAAAAAASGGGGGGGVSPYWRCLAIFEDFSQDFFAALRATAASAVVEHSALRPPSQAAAAGLAAPWQWFAGPAALVGEAVYGGMPADDAASTAVNLALEDAAVLGGCVAAHGLSGRALAEYARQRGPRVSGMLSLPPASPERLRLRDAPFLAPSQPPTAAPAAAPAAALPAAAAAAAGAAVVPSLTETVEAAIDKAAEETVAAAAAPPLAEILAKASEATAQLEESSQRQRAAEALQSDAGAAAGPSVDFSRPSGGASRTASPGTDAGSSTDSGSRPVPSPVVLPAGPSSLIFTRPSGVRRMGLVPSAIAAVVGLMTSKHIHKGPEPSGAAPSSNAAATVTAPPRAAAAEAAEPGTALPQCAAPYTSDSTPQAVWKSLLRPGAEPRGASAPPGVGATAAAEGAEAGSSRPAGQYCSSQTPAAVWRVLLVAPQAAHNALASRPYDAAESPALVWAALLGAQEGSRGSSSPAPGSSPPVTAAAPSPSSLLPRPVPKQKPAADAEPEPDCSAQDLPAPLAPAPVQQDAQAAAPPSAAHNRGAGTAGQVRKERRARGAAAAAAAGSTRRAGKAAPKRSSATVGAATSAAATLGRRAVARGAGAASKARDAAKAAATMTVSLSAAAALGGVISAGGGHMPVDVTSALHVHGAVAQFWDELNHLTLSSASLSSMDV